MSEPIDYELKTLLARYAEAYASVTDYTLEEVVQEIVTLIQRKETEARIYELDKALLYKQEYIPIGYGADRTREAIPDRYIENRLAELHRRSEGGES